MGQTTAESPAPPTQPRVFLAWCVHAYTGLGLIAAAGIAYLLAPEHPSSAAFQGAFLLMLLATLIDATDGTFARMVRVKEVLPGFDGRRLDDLIDFLNYTCLPLYLLWRADLLAPFSTWWLLVPLAASAYGFCQTDVKTEDGYFLGFPSHWNLIAFYFYVLAWPGWLCLGLSLFFSVLTFVPIRYLYPTQPGLLNRVTLVLCYAWVPLFGWLLWAWESPSQQQMAYLSMVFPVFYMAASWWISIRYFTTKA